MWKNRFFKSFSDFDQKSLNKEIKFTRRIVKTAFKVFRGTILGLFSRMKKPCSKILSLSEINGILGWTFCQISQSCSLWVQRTFWGFFGEKSNCLVIFGFWAKVTNFWQKNFWQVAKSAFHVSSAKLWEKMVKVIYTIDIFFRTWSEFFLILAKKIVRCVETVI